MLKWNSFSHMLQVLKAENACYNAAGGVDSRNRYVKKHYYCVRRDEMWTKTKDNCQEDIVGKILSKDKRRYCSISTITILVFQCDYSHGCCVSFMPSFVLLT